jgi:ribonuclease P protein component
MIAQEHRFHGTASLRFVFGRGSIVRGPFFSIKYARNTRRTSYRAAVIVSKKVHKSAVKRNRIRRRLYEIIRQREDRLTRPYDIVLLVHNQDAATVDIQKLKTALTNQLAKAGII